MARRRLFWPSRAFLLWVARLAVFSLVFQLAAIGHWHREPDDVVGLIGAASHAAHCHGDVSACQGQAFFGDVDLSSQLRARPSAPLVRTALSVLSLPPDAFIAPLDKPPRALG